MLPYACKPNISQIKNTSCKIETEILLHDQLRPHATVFYGVLMALLCLENRLAVATLRFTRSHRYDFGRQNHICKILNIIRKKTEPKRQLSSNTSDCQFYKNIRTISTKNKEREFFSTCRSVISIKLPCNFTEIALRQGCCPVNLLHIFRTPFPKTTFGVPLLKQVFDPINTSS